MSGFLFPLTCLQATTSHVDTKMKKNEYIRDWSSETFTFSNHSPPMLSKVGPHTVRVEIFIMTVDPYHGIQITRKELSKTVVMIANWKNLLFSMAYMKILYRFRG